jgi:dihydroorotate dehydrogenase (fumarate)
MDMPVNIAGVGFDHRVMNAAGTVKTKEELLKLAGSATAALMVGSITLAPRNGNSGEVFWSSPPYSLNALGIPSRGAEFYKAALPEMVTIAQDAGKPLFVSVAGLTVDEFGILAEMVMLGGADVIELNLGCPNMWDGITQKPVACFDFDYVAEILRAVESRVGRQAVVSVKISPFSDRMALERLAQLFNESELVKIVTTTNTFPNAVAYEERGKKPVLSTENGFGGLSGEAMLPVGLGQVTLWRKNLDKRISVVGVGGISRGSHIWLYLLSGAVLTQVATAYLFQREHIFHSLLQEFLALEEWYTS